MDAASSPMRCLVTGQPVTIETSTALDAMWPAVQDLIRADFPQAGGEARLSREALVQYRRQYVESILAEERGEVSALEQEVVKAISEEALLSQHPDDQVADHPPTFGENVADRVASFGGSWRFLISFGFFLLLWLALNSLRQETFDPYPFILLNLLLSCLASIQAPIIMMSQNRKEARDRLAALHDYQVNLKAELGIRHLHEKIDHLMGRQWERLAAIQQMQIDLMEKAWSEAGPQLRRVPDQPGAGVP